MKQALKDFMTGLRFDVSSRVFARQVLIDAKLPVVSFTFDDVPAVTFEKALPVLNKYHALATFYVAAGLSRDRQGYFGKKEIAALAEQGHEIGSHTFAHSHTGRLLPGAMRREIEQTRDYFQENFPGLDPENFSYPFGSIGLWNKPVLARHYRSLRSTHPGINRGHVDLNTLSAFRLYSSRLDEEKIEVLMQDLAAGGGWLIFYSHDVTETPSRVGCTPGLLESALKSAQNAGAKVLPVRQVLTEILPH